MNQGNSTRVGTITAHRYDRIFAVELDGGATIDANVKSHTARVMFRIVPGDRVRVRLPATDGQLALILGHHRDDLIDND